MPSSFLKHHRTICNVLDAISKLAQERSEADIVDLCAEAKGYAQSMSAKLVDRKNEAKEFERIIADLSRQAHSG